MKIPVLFLDDNPNRHRKFFENNHDMQRTHVYTAKDCLDELENNSHFDIIFLDHDLDPRTNNVLVDGEKDGRYVAEKMTNPDLLTKYKGSIVVIHSLNSMGAKIMKKTLEEAGYEHVILQPYVWEIHVRSEISNWI